MGGIPMKVCPDAPDNPVMFNPKNFARDRAVNAFLEKDNFYMFGEHLVMPFNIATVAAGPEVIAEES